MTEVDRSKRPSYQWYPGDFRRDVAVQACTFEARALWREMLDLMHDGEPYGHLTAGGVPIDTAQLARIVGVSGARVKRWLTELEDRKVFSRTEAGVIYSRRMVRDEHIRRVRKEAGAKGGNPALRDKARDNGLVNQPDNPVDSQSVADAVGSLQSASASADETTGYSPRAADAGVVGVVTGQPADVAILLTAAANRGITERYGERPTPLRHDAATSYEATEAILAAGVPVEFARAAIFTRAKRCELARPPYSLKYFVPGVLDDWSAHRAREVAAELPAPDEIVAGATAASGRPRPTKSRAQESYDHAMAALEDV